MTSKELLQEYKIKYIDNAPTYRDGGKNLENFFLNYFKEMKSNYKSYNQFFKSFYTYGFNIILTPSGLWHYEHDIFYNAISKTLDKKIKSIMKQLNYIYLYDI